MKVIAVFSGKGGVGKTTVASLLALALSEKHRVVLLDLDIHTPSVPVMFGPDTRVKNLEFVSTGYKTSGAIVLTGAMVKKTLKDLVNNTMRTNPDICIIDMPPGNTDVHMQVCSTLKPSAAILVVQPNRLCEEDAIRACGMFMKAGIGVIGVIANMTGDVFGNEENVKIMGLPVLATIPLKKGLARAGSNGSISNIKANPLSKICEEIYEGAGDANWVYSKQILLGGVSGELVRELDVIPQEFVGLASWEVVREHLMDREVWGERLDRFLTCCTFESVRRMLSGLDEMKAGTFMVIVAPNTEIDLFPGEIGTANLAPYAKSYYAVPRLLYHTDEGTVTLFPFEVTPVNSEDILMHQSEGSMVCIPGTTTPRFLPSVKAMEELEDEFGFSRIGLRSDWKARYEKLGIH